MSKLIGSLAITAVFGAFAGGCAGVAMSADTLLGAVVAFAAVFVFATLAVAYINDAVRAAG